MNGANIKALLTEHLNFRMILFFAVVLVLIGWPVYIYISESLTRGVHRRGAYLEVGLKDLGRFDFDPVNPDLADVPHEYRALDGKKVLLEGEVYDPEETGEITSWVLVYQVGTGFSTLPRVQERVYCTAAPGKSFTLADRTYHKVMGTLHVAARRKKLPDGSLGPAEELYHMDVQSVE